METNKMYKTVQAMIGTVLLLLVVLITLFIDTIYLTSSVRVSLVAFGIIGGLLLMNGSVVTETKVEVKIPNVLPLEDLKKQQVLVHKTTINKLNNYIKQLEDVEVWLDKVSMEGTREIKMYLYDELGRNQAMLQSLEWDEEADSNKKAWEGHRNTVVQADNLDFRPLKHQDKGIMKVVGIGVPPMKEEELQLNPISNDVYWYYANGTPFTISQIGWNNLFEEEKSNLIRDNVRGMEVRGL